MYEPKIFGFAMYFKSYIACYTLHRKAGIGRPEGSTKNVNPIIQMLRAEAGISFREDWAIFNADFRTQYFVNNPEGNPSAYFLTSGNKNICMTTLIIRIDDRATCLHVYNIRKYFACNKSSRILIIPLLSSLV